MSEKGRKKERIEFVEKIDNLKQFYISGVYGGLDPGEGRMMFFTDTPIPITDADKKAISTKHIKREYILDIRMSSVTFVSIAKWMTNYVNKLKKSGILKEMKEGVDIPIGDDYFI